MYGLMHFKIASHSKAKMVPIIKEHSSVNV